MIRQKYKITESVCLNCKHKIEIIGVNRLNNVKSTYYCKIIGKLNIINRRILACEAYERDF